MTKLFMNSFSSLKLTGIIFAFVAAAFYALNMPVSKVLLNDISPTFLASFLYLGAGIGIGILYFLFGKNSSASSPMLTKDDRLYVMGMVILDIAAPIFLMFGLYSTSAASASLLNNFEIVATAIIALIVFKEAISKRLWVAIFLITIASIILSLGDISGLEFSYGSLLVLLACVCWGLENNCTRKISYKNTYEIVFIKGIFSGLGAFIIAVLIGELPPQLHMIFYALILGFVAYGLSIFFYVRAQKELGAARTSAGYAVAPFISVFFSFLIFSETLTLSFFIALMIMIAGTALVVYDVLVKHHTHLHTHTIVHTHNGSTHKHIIQHSHPHDHLMSEAEHMHHHSKEEQDECK